jgi:hypothetical protein
MGSRCERHLCAPKTSVFGCLALVALASACFSSTKAPPTEKTCEDNCDRQVRAGCANTPTDFGASCKQACLAYRATYPDCVALMNAMSGCVSDKVTFGCDSSGGLTHDPIAICMNEEYGCYACTADFAPCRN